jgi:Tol biopolymer transport system component
MNTIETFISSPTFGSLTAIPEERLVGYWWTDNEKTALRLHNPASDEIDIVEIDGFDPRGNEPLIWTGEAFIVSTRPETYLVNRDGTTKEILPENEYTLAHDIGPEGRYILYTHYEEIHAEKWPLKLYDRKQERIQTLTEDPEQGGHAGFSPDGQWIAFRENPEDRFHEGRHVVTTREGEREHSFTIADSEYRSQQHGWHPDNERLLVADRSSGLYQIGLYDWQTDETIWFGPGKYQYLTKLPS